MTNDEGGRRLGLDNEQGKQIYTFYVNIGAGLTVLRASSSIPVTWYPTPPLSSAIFIIFWHLLLHFWLPQHIKGLLSLAEWIGSFCSWAVVDILKIVSGWHLLPFVKTANRTEQPLWRQCPVKILLTNKWHNNRMTIQLQRNQYNLHFLWRLDNWIIISENRFSPFTVLLLRMQCNTGICAVYKVEIM